MVINNPTVSVSYTPSSISEITRTNAQPLVDKAQVAQAQQSSTVVKLSTQGQTLSLSDRPGSMGENSESRGKESGEAASIQFMEGEGQASAAQAVSTSASSALATYSQVAAQ